MNITVDVVDTALGGYKRYNVTDFNYLPDSEELAISPTGSRQRLFLDLRVKSVQITVSKNKEDE